MQTQFAMLSLNSAVQGLSNEILEAHANVLTGETSIRNDIVVKEDAGAQIAFDSSNIVAFNCRCRYEEYQFPRCKFPLRELAVAFLVCRYSIGIEVR